MNHALLVLTNMPDEISARALAMSLLESKLAACINISRPIRSLYRWNGTIEDSNEVAVQIKTTQMRYPELQSAIQRVHPYDVPEIIAVPIVDGLPAYLDWITQQTKKDFNV